MLENLQNTEEYVKQAYTKYSPLTGLYYNKAFFKEADEYIKNVEAGKYMMLAIDIENFRLFNKLHGRTAGDVLLIHIADCMKNCLKDGNGIAGYLGSDNFGLLAPYCRELVDKLNSDIFSKIEPYSDSLFFKPAFGIYIINDLSMSAIAAYDCATVALMRIKGDYVNRISEYVPEMDEKLEEELKLLAKIKEGLKNDEFTFFIQPQCDISSGRIVGGESLVRWWHNGKLVSPGIFVPVLEKKGFIAELDMYVWEKVCAWLRSWLDRGHNPVPVSINISRKDILSFDVPAYLKELIEKYELPAKLIKLEITESAYAENDDKIIKTVKQLRDSSFLVMMDDFGSGYSSLNMLKSVAVDVLKMDMRFLEIDEYNEQKGIGILESVINMARQLKIPIIVEGVETQKQENFLLRMGCRYTQGYYYFKPMPIEEFEALICDERNIDHSGIWCNQVEQMHVREFLDENLFSDTMVNNIIGAAAFYDMHDNQIEITRVNEQYYKMSGSSSQEDAANCKKIWNHVRDDDRQRLFAIFEQAYEETSNGSEGYIHYVRSDGIVLWVHMRVFFLRENDGHKLFYGSFTDMTSMHEHMKKHIENEKTCAIKEEEKNNLEKYYGNLPCGYGVVKILIDGNDTPYDYELIYANHELSKTSDGDMDRLRYIINKTFKLRKQEMLDKAYLAAYKGEVVNVNTYSNLTGRYLCFTFFEYEYGYVSFIMRDVTHRTVYQNALNSIMYTYREVYFVQLQDNYSRMIYPDDNHMLDRGNYQEMINRHFKMGKIVKYDEDNVRNFLSLENLREALKDNDTTEYKYKRTLSNGDEEWCLATFIVSERKNGVPISAIFTLQSIEAFMRENEEYRHQNMAKLLVNMSEGFFIYEADEQQENIVYVNPTVFKIYGCKDMQEFLELTGGSFKGMVHPDDIGRIEYEIKEQINTSRSNMDYIRYRIIRKDGQIRWIDDCGHFEEAFLSSSNKKFYVFITDITDNISDEMKERLIALSNNYNSINK